LEALLRDHADDPAHPNAVCLHGRKGGTVSSSILAFHDTDPGQHLFQHCQGRPCENSYEPVEWPGGFFADVPEHSSEE
jgi:hypothetical protein